MLSLWIHHGDRLLGGGEGKPFRVVSRHAVHHHLSEPLRYFYNFGLDPDYRPAGLSPLDLKPYPMASSHDQSSSRRAIFLADCRKDGRREDRLRSVDEGKA